MDIEKLNQSIIQALAYFDIFEQPLTKEELYQSLFCKDRKGLKISYTDFLSHLENSLPDTVEDNEGFYFLKGRGEVVDKRQLKIKLAEQKFKIALRGIKKISSMPFVKAVFVCNTLGMGVMDGNSDIDVFIVVKNGRLWLTRLLVTLILSLFRLRRTKTKIKDRICLSFYVTDNNLNLEKITIAEPDVYMIYWLNNLVPVYDPKNFYQSIVEANSWVKEFLPNGLQPYKASSKYKVEGGKFGHLTKNILEKMWNGNYGDLLENQAKSIQEVKMKLNSYSVHSAPDSRVIINDQMMKFHENDRRDEYRNKWLEMCKKFNS